jgi:hypothetical protein
MFNKLLSITAQPYVIVNIAEYNLTREIKIMERKNMTNTQTKLLTSYRRGFYASN